MLVLVVMMVRGQMHVPLPIRIGIGHSGSMTFVEHLNRGGVGSEARTIQVGRATIAVGYHCAGGRRQRWQWVDNIFEFMRVLVMVGMVMIVAIVVVTAMIAIGIELVVFGRFQSFVGSLLQSVRIADLVEPDGTKAKEEEEKGSLVLTGSNVVVCVMVFEFQNLCIINRIRMIDAPSLPLERTSRDDH